MGLRMRQDMRRSISQVHPAMRSKMRVPSRKATSAKWRVYLTKHVPEGHGVHRWKGLEGLWLRMRQDVHRPISFVHAAMRSKMRVPSRVATAAKWRVHLTKHVPEGHGVHRR